MCFSDNINGFKKNRQLTLNQPNHNGNVVTNA